MLVFYWKVEIILILFDLGDKLTWIICTKLTTDASKIYKKHTASKR